MTEVFGTLRFQHGKWQGTMELPAHLRITELSLRALPHSPPGAAAEATLDSLAYPLLQGTAGCYWFAIHNNRSSLIGLRP